jgi:branched-chain amino acid transport system substrate-binding protein
MLATRRALLAAATVGAGLIPGLRAQADEPVKFGLILPMTGPFEDTGKQIVAAAKLYMQQNGDTVAGRKIELIVRDDAGVPDTTKRLAQEMVVNDHIAAMGGFGLTPLALAAAPIATRAKVPEIVMAAQTAAIVEASPYIVRTTTTIPQSTIPMADWAATNGIKTVVTLVTDYGPGIDAENWFKREFPSQGGTVMQSLRVPLLNPDFSPFLQRAHDAKPDALFVFVPAGVGAPFAKQFVERGLDKSGIKLIALGDVTDDDVLNGMGDAMMGVVTAQFYSAAHDSSMNKSFVADFEKANNNMRPNFMACAGYDGMHLFYAALAKTNGDTDGTKLIDAMKGMSWESPRGPVRIDPDSRDPIHNVYIRRVEKVGGQLYNVEFETFKDVATPSVADRKS